MRAKTKKKIWWKDFIRHPAFSAMEKALAHYKCRLVIVWSPDGNKATDVHVYKITGAHERPSA